MESEVLKELFPSDAQPEALESIFLNPGERLYRSELGSRLSFAPIRLLIPRLVATGLLIQEEEGKRKKSVYYRANPDCPLFIELRNSFLESRRRKAGNGKGHPWAVSDSGHEWHQDGTPSPGLQRNGKDSPAHAHVPSSGRDPDDPEDSILDLGTGKAMEEVRRLIRRLAPSDTIVLVSGERGTGKETVARAIHKASPRSGMRFFSVDCSTFSESSLEALLFGVQRGGANGQGPGILGWPDGGTVFLREIDASSLPLQRKLLRTIEARRYVPMDAISPLPLTVRLICGSSLLLSRNAADEGFLQELYAKLALFEIRMPSLRERTQDIPRLIRHLIGCWCRTLRREEPALEPEAEQELMNRPWQGNMRELSGVIERTLILLERPSIGLSDLPAALASVDPPEPEALREAVKQFSRRHVALILHKYGNDKVEAAKALRVDLSTIYRWAKEQTT